MGATDFLDPDLALCDRDPITLYATIQSFGFLIAVSSDDVIVRTSSNIDLFFGISPLDLLGVNWTRIICHKAQHDIRDVTAYLAAQKTARLFAVSLSPDRGNFDLSLHVSGDLLIIEGEPSQEVDGAQTISTVQYMIRQLEEAKSLQSCHQLAARQIRALTGFDRVMIYRFDQDGNGEVIAESARFGIETLLGLHFPASDIPPQARALCLRNTLRIIPDVGSAQILLLQRGVPEDHALDQSLVVGRGVSPVHVEYLRNMGVAASMTISVIVAGKLWGLITCHNKTARLPSFVMRTAAELFGGMYSMALHIRLQHEELESEKVAREFSGKLTAEIAMDAAFSWSASRLQTLLLNTIDCDGVVVLKRGQVSTSGSVPSGSCLNEIVDRLDRIFPPRVFDTDQLCSLVNGPDVGSKVAGFLAIPISNEPSNYIILFRNELLYSINWSGNPSKTMTQSDDGLRLSPRKSFVAFEERIRGRSRAFGGRERDVAESIRVAKIEIVSKFQDSAQSERNHAAKRQEILIAELNHRVRNILTLIRSLINQTGRGASDVNLYVNALSARVESLARAHDQVTQQNWGPCSLNDLLYTECTAHLHESGGKLFVDGPAVLLMPPAITSIILVIHELVTNSVKYGALSTQGSLHVTIHAPITGGINLFWRESGGPPVRVPSRRGFGAAIVQRVIPFDLGGTAEVRYAEGGLEASFFIPAEHVSSTPPREEAGDDHHKSLSQEVTKPDILPLSGLRVLLVEDNLIIALEAESLILGLGAGSVETVATLAAAADVLAAQPFDFAILDFNIGQDTTTDLALHLQALGVPYVFATGDSNPIHPGDGRLVVPVVKKPYQKMDLARAIALQRHHFG